MTFLIVGAGIGGLTLAIALRRRGFAVEVLDQRPSFADEGAGVVLGPNVMAALAALGLDTAVAAQGRPVAAMNITNASGHVLARSAYAVPELPRPGIAIHRSRLHDVLRAACDAPIHLGAAVTRLEAGAAWVGEHRHPADVIVGADGIRSAVRAHLNPGFTTRYSGVTCWRFVVEQRWTDEVFEMWGAGKRVGIVPIGEQRTYVFLTHNAPQRAPAPFTDLAGFRATWSAFGGPAPHAFAAVDDLRRVLHNDLEDGIPPVWHAPGFVLVGDAAHAVTPNMGQGAGLAIEDAACLAALYAEAPDTAPARFDTLRRPRATWIRDQSYQFGRVAQLESAPLRWVRDRILSWTPASVNDAALRRVVTDMPGVPVG
jgi:2-heptyl-3-hydroxy-4(1H)-quinolone synthase